MCTKLSENLSMWPKSWQAILIQILSQSPSTSLSFSRQVNKQTILTSAPGRATPNSAENNPKKILQPAEIYISTLSHTHTPRVWQPTEVGPKWRKLHDGFATSVRRSFTADVPARRADDRFGSSAHARGLNSGRARSSTRCGENSARCLVNEGKLRSTRASKWLLLSFPSAVRQLTVTLANREVCCCFCLVFFWGGWEFYYIELASNNRFTITLFWRHGWAKEISFQ